MIEKSIEEIVKDCDLIMEKVLAFSITDTIFFWSEAEGLHERQKKRWFPIIYWLEEVLAVKISYVFGLEVVSPKPDYFLAIRKELKVFSSREFAIFYMLMIKLRSFALAFAIMKGKMSATEAFESSYLEEIWQAEVWGQDEEAFERRENILEEVREIENSLRPISKVRMIVSGRVQGVGYRAWVVKKALKLGDVFGYAKNLDDGSVEVFAIGSLKNIGKFIIDCGKGPLFSKIDDIVFEDDFDVLEFPDFKEKSFIRI